MEGGWDELFDESYLATYVPFLDEERTRAEALGAVALAGLAPGAEVLDVPCGFARHALVLTEAGYRVTGADRSPVQLAEAERRRGGADWPRLVRADYRELPFPDASSDAVLCLFTALGYLDRAGDVGVLGEFRRVLRPGGALVVETMHRDRLAHVFRPRHWDHLPEGGLFLHEHEFDQVAGVSRSTHLIIDADGRRTERSYDHRVYTPTEWVAMLREAGFTEVEAYGGFEREPVSIENRLWLLARAR
jgi:ubiquinone/menaquinone biosynthesis C-methylase UbiE